MAQNAPEHDQELICRARTIQLAEAANHMELADAYASGRKSTFGHVFGISDIDQAAQADRDKARTHAQLSTSLLDAADRGLILDKYIKQARKDLRKERKKSKWRG